MLAILPLVAGCFGYHVGNQSLYPAHIYTVYVPIFESDSFRRHLGERLTERVMKRIEEVTPYKVINSPDADSILTGRIIADAKRVVVEDRFDNPREVELNMAVRVRWIDRRGNPLRDCPAVPLPPELTTVSASATVVPEVGQSIATGQVEAIDKLAEQIVSMMETPW